MIIKEYHEGMCDHGIGRKQKCEKCNAEDLLRQRCVTPSKFRMVYLLSKLTVTKNASAAIIEAFLGWKDVLNNSCRAIIKQTL